MTGPEHYRKAEALLELGNPDAEFRAGVHATLALAAATAVSRMTYVNYDNSTETHPHGDWSGII